jgi:hypothetical protein
VDKDIVVTLPEQWEDQETARKIDERLRAGTFKEYAQFDLTMIVESSCIGKLKKCRLLSSWLLKNIKQ